MGRHGHWAPDMDSNSITSLKPQLRWIYATEVCSRWRNIALNTPALWANQVPDHPMLAAVFLERSKDAGLIIRSPIQTPNTYSPRGRRHRPFAVPRNHGRMKYELVKPHLHRARVLQISLVYVSPPLEEMILEALSAS